jgi:hypothetical protein
MLQTQRQQKTVANESEQAEGQAYSGLFFPGSGETPTICQVAQGCQS